MLTTDELSSTTFTTTRREGYEMREVDELVARATETLRHRDTVTPRSATYPSNSRRDP